ncbi:MAG: hypothetical protein KA184_00845 [Candidatus Hydrogenedentes bacterium]|nr:hypothetical protein [Candidatus Hydrogenedentota bacterium]
MNTRFSQIALLAAPVFALLLAGCVSTTSHMPPPAPTAREVLDHVESVPALTMTTEPRAGAPIATVRVRSTETHFFVIEDAGRNRTPSRTETQETVAGGVVVQAEMHYSGAVRRIDAVTSADGTWTVDLTPFIRAAYEDVRNERLRVVFLLPDSGTELVYDIPQDTLGHLYRAL